MLLYYKPLIDVNLINLAIKYGLFILLSDNPTSKHIQNYFKLSSGKFSVCKNVT